MNVPEEFRTILLPSSFEPRRSRGFDEGSRREGSTETEQQKSHHLLQFHQQHLMASGNALQDCPRKTKKTRRNNKLISNLVISKLKQIITLDS